MNIDPVIKVENLSKVYNISPIKSIWSKLPFFGNNHNPQKHLIWALKDINFEVKKGEALGVIGPNGAGKSTLLKMLCGVTKPTTGNFQIKGRVAPLIEIGAGFHPEMTGRENIWLNATIMGMSKKEIDRKFKDIVDFAELRDFIDTPFKKYSSGMKVRLGFATAIHCEPDVLLVDEVLSVGDMGFRRKCLNRMQELRKRNITTLFVSHNLHTIDGLCNRTIFLNNGKINAQGETFRVIQAYQAYINEQTKKGIRREFGLPTDWASNEIDIKNIQFIDKDGQEKDTFFTDEKMIARVTYFASHKFEKPIFSFGIARSDGVVCCIERTKYHDFQIDYIEGIGSLEIEFEKIQLHSGVYVFYILIYDSTLSLPYAYRRQDKFTVETYMPDTGYDCIFHPIVKWRKV